MTHSIMLKPTINMVYFFSVAQPTGYNCASKDIRQVHLFSIKYRAIIWKRQIEHYTSIEGYNNRIQNPSTITTSTSSDSQSTKILNDLMISD